MIARLLLFCLFLFLSRQTFECEKIRVDQYSALVAFEATGNGKFRFDVRIVWGEYRSKYFAKCVRLICSRTRGNQQWRNWGMICNVRNAITLSYTLLRFIKAFRVVWSLKSKFIHCSFFRIEYLATAKANAPERKEKGHANVAKETWHVTTFVLATKGNAKIR